MANQQQQRIQGKYFGKKLKAKKVIELYQAGERNFQGVILRGQSCKGHDLSGADFSEADIRSTNFSNATLIGSNFSGAKCGLENCWVILLIIVSWLLAVISGIFILLVLQLLNYDSESDIFALISLMVFCAFIYFTIRKGIKALAAAIFVAMAVALSFSVAGAGTASGIVAGVVAVAGLFTFAVAGVNAGLGTFAFAGMIVGLVKGIMIQEDLPTTISSGLISGAIAGTFVMGALNMLSLMGDDKHVYTSFAVPFAAIKGTSFNNADLSEANFRKARLKSTDLRKANLTRVCWYKVTMLDFACFDNVLLKDTQLRLWLIGQGNNNNFNHKKLKGINLQGADLTDASFIGSDLSESNLRDTNLSRTKLLDANLDGTFLTGACIQDWIVNHQTSFDSVVCKYVFLKNNEQERRPSDPHRNFDSGDFAKLVEKSLNTVDLIFSKGVDWKAVAYSLKNTKVLNKNIPLSIQSIDDKGNGFVLIRVTVPENIDKGKVEGDFWQGYEFANKTLKEHYEARIIDKDEEINRLFDIITQGKEVQKLMAEQPKNQQNFNAPVYGVAGNVEGNQNIYASEQKQTLAEAADEIQKLLKQLEQTNPTATEEEKIVYVNEETSLGFKKRTVSALKAGVETGIEEFLDNPYVNVGKAIVKAWIKPE